MDTWDPVSTSAIISTPFIITVSLPQPISHTKGLGSWYPGSAASLSVLTGTPGSPLPGCASQGARWRCLLPPPNFCLKECSDIPRPHAPNHHNRNILSYCDHVFHDDFDHCYLPLCYSHFYLHSLCYPMVQGCKMQFAVVASRLPPQLHNLLF